MTTATTATTETTEERAASLNKWLLSLTAKIIDTGAREGAPGAYIVWATRGECESMAKCLDKSLGGGSHSRRNFSVNGEGPLGYSYSIPGLGGRPMIILSWVQDCWTHQRAWCVRAGESVCLSRSNK